MAEKIFTNGNIVTRNSVFRGTVVVENDIITKVDDALYNGRTCYDLEGQMLLPGLVEMHTDNLEKHIQPRPGVIWPSIMSAALSHDIQIAGSGITTVYDAITVGGLRASSLRSKILAGSIRALEQGSKKKIFKADHYIHLRCEICDSRMEEMLCEHGRSSSVGLVSVMDHTPGQRQWTNLDKWKLFHRDKKWTEREIENILVDMQEMQKRFAEKHRSTAVAFARENNLPLASHDDTSVEDAETAAEEGITIAEFPTTLAAAARAKEMGMSTIMGAPNAIRGGSHSGNISASVLAEKNLLDGLSSDYVPSSLLHSAFHLADSFTIPLAKTVAMISANIADMINLKDRGELAPGKKADMLQVTRVDQLPVIRKVWKSGKHVT